MRRQRLRACRSAQRLVQCRAAPLPECSQLSSSAQLQSFCPPLAEGSDDSYSATRPADGAVGVVAVDVAPVLGIGLHLAGPGNREASLAKCWDCGTRAEMPVGYHRDVCIASPRGRSALSRTEYTPVPRRGSYHTGSQPCSSCPRKRDPAPMLRMPLWTSACAAVTDYIMSDANKRQLMQRGARRVREQPAP
jgi:hypothetical protein